MYNEQWNIGVVSIMLIEKCVNSQWDIKVVSARSITSFKTCETLNVHCNLQEENKIIPIENVTSHSKHMETQRTLMILRKLRTLDEIT